MFSALAHSLDENDLTNGGSDTRSWRAFGNMSGIFKLAEALPHSQLTSLRWPTRRLNCAWTLCLCLPLRQQPLTLCVHCLGSLANNKLCGVTILDGGTYTIEGIDALCDALKSTTTLTSLKYASQLEPNELSHHR